LTSASATKEIEMRIRAKFQVVGVEHTPYKVFKKVFQSDVSEEEYAAIQGNEYTESYGAKKGKYKSVDTGKGQQNVRLAAVYDTSNPEDVHFAEATPSGELKMLVNNPAVIAQFEPGQNYYVDLVKCD
jgi:hypothetical protein